VAKLELAGEGGGELMCMSIHCEQHMQITSVDGNDHIFAVRIKAFLSTTNTSNRGRENQCDANTAILLYLPKHLIAYRESQDPPNWPSSFVRFCSASEATPWVEVCRKVL